MRLSELAPAPGAKHKAKRVGRGPGSGWGNMLGAVGENIHLIRPLSDKSFPWLAVLPGSDRGEGGFGSSGR